MVGTAAASIEGIPAELMIQILCNLPNLFTLHKLTVASPHAFRVFNENGMSFLDQMVKNETPPEIVCLIRLVVQIHACTAETSPAPTMWEFQDDYTGCLDAEGEDCRRLAPHGRLDTYKLLERSAGTPLDQIQRPSSGIGYSARQILLLIRKVALMTEACITYFRHKCLKVKKMDCSPIANLFPGSPYRPADYGPPSWIETQRATRGFWRFILHHELQTAAEGGRMG